MKNLAAILLFSAATLGIPSAYALGISSECAPEFNIKITESDGTENQWNDRWEKDNTTSISIGFKWKFGLGSQCKQLNAHRIKTQYYRADQERTEAWEDKIKVCKSFKKSTAPYSIKNFCGDLITRD